MTDNPEISRLYQQGWGLKRIARELSLPVSTIRRRLLAMNIYEGIAHGVAYEEEEDASEGEELTPPLEQEAISYPGPGLEQWTPKGDASVERDGNGWILSLGGDPSSALVSPPLEGEWTDRGIEFNADLRLVSPGFGTVCLGVKDEGSAYGDEGSCPLQNAIVPSRFHIKHLCLAPPVLYFKGNSYNAITAVVSGLTVCETASAGLKPVIIPEERRLEAGEKILLTSLWRTDGSSVIKPAPWSTSGLLVGFAGAGTIHATLPHAVAGHKARLMVELRSLAGSPEIKIVLGDDEAGDRLITRAKRDPTMYSLERIIGRNGFASISCGSYSREEILLERAEIEVIL